MTDRHHLTAHTPLDLEALERAGVDPASTQPREWPVPCSVCRASTFHLGRGCERHFVAPVVRHLDLVQS